MVAVSLVAASSTSGPEARLSPGAKLTPRLTDPARLAGRATVIDAATIEIEGERIYLWGIIAPGEHGECSKQGQPWRCGTDAANALAEFLGEHTVTCLENERYRDGRIIANCKLGDQDVGVWLVRQGWALDDVRYSDGAYTSEEEQAEAERLGLWQGVFQPPWEWRRH